MSMKISNDTIGNRTRDLPACSVVPQPTALPCAPIFAIKQQLKKGKEKTHKQIERKKETVRGRSKAILYFAGE